MDKSSYGDELRYDEKILLDRKPIVVWNMTRTCNLKCIHCYADSENKKYDGELTTQEAKIFIQDLVDFKVPVLLFSGGEPLIREDIFELAQFARELGLRTVISSNGTLITKNLALKIKNTGFSYVGISIDGIGINNDNFRGKSGAFESALSGIRNLRAVEQKVGLRFTINKHNFSNVPDIFDLVIKENINRICFYHLVYSGRGSDMKNDDISLAEKRKLMDFIFEQTKRLNVDGRNVEVLMVDNHADAVYLYRKIEKENLQKAVNILNLLKINGGNNSGIAISCVDNLGFVHADQFWGHYSFGNIRERKFGDIWMDTSDSLMAGLKNRKTLLNGKCGRCCYLDICNGNFRVRAEAVYNDIWAEDPACYLTEEEISV
jgi:radical SAM protein with 4Fe4S-binding SPASM domain